MSARPLTLGDSELMAQHQDLGVLPPRLPPRQAQHRHRTGQGEEDQLQAHKRKIIPPPAGAKRLTKRLHSAGNLPRWHEFPALTGKARNDHPSPPAGHPGEPPAPPDPWTA